MEKRAAPAKSRSPSPAPATRHFDFDELDVLDPPVIPPPSSEAARRKKAEAAERVRARREEEEERERALAVEAKRAREAEEERRRVEAEEERRRVEAEEKRRRAEAEAEEQRRRREAEEAARALRRAEEERAQRQAEEARAQQAANDERVRREAEEERARREAEDAKASAGSGVAQPPSEGDGSAPSCPPGMVDITVRFRLGRSQWSLDFRVSEGAAFSELKQAMLKNAGTEEELRAFELRRGKRRVSDFETVQSAETLDFKFLGEERGARRAALDRAAQEASVEAGPGAARGDEVEVVVRNAMPEHQSQVTVSVPSGATYRDVKNAVVAVIKEKQVERLKLVARTSGGFRTIDDAEKIGSSREILATGPRLELATAGKKSNSAKSTPSLTIEQALSMQRELFKGFSQDTFQQKLRALEKAHRKGSGEYLKGRQELCLTVQRPILPKYGFESSQRGVFSMMVCMADFNNNPEFVEMGMKINALLEVENAALVLEAAKQSDTPLTVTFHRDLQDPAQNITLDLPKGATVTWVKEFLSKMDPTGKIQPSHFRLCTTKRLDQALEEDSVVTAAQSSLTLYIPPGAQQQQPQPAAKEEPVRSTSVRVQHAVKSSYIVVDVPSNATIRDVRQAVMAATGQTRLSEVKIVKKSKNGSFASEVDGEALNGRATLRMLGCDLPNAGTIKE